MEFSTLEVTLDAGVATIALNRPDKANAMSEPMWYEIEQAMEWLDSTPEARVGVLVGRGKYFTSGIDLAMLMGLGAQDRGRLRRPPPREAAPPDPQAAGHAELHRALPQAGAGRRARRLHRRRHRPDHRLRHALLLGQCLVQVKEVDVGMTADVGTLQRLPRLIGEGMARELAYTGRRVDGAEAQAMRLVNRCFDTPEALQSGVMEIARTIAAKSPLSIRGCKEMITYARDHSVADGLNYIATWNAAMLMSKDLFEAGAANMQKRDPVFKD
jgi:enoyl-CoA hydratase